jgi:hypothetical protein
MSSAPRPLTAAERAIIDRFRDVVIPARDALAKQLELVEVRGESKGYLLLTVPADAPPITVSAGFPLDGWYADSDGTLVSLILHVAFPEGKIDSLERYRVDGEDITNLTPDAASVSVGRNPLEDPNQFATFDPQTGWTRNPPA